MLTCPNCKKELAPATTPCPRCRADLTLLVDYMDNVDEQLSKADSAMKSGELGSAVWAYLNVLETDPENPIARRQVLSVATAIRQFDEAKRTGMRLIFALGVTLTLSAVMMAGEVLYGGYLLGVWRATPKPPPATTQAAE